MIPESVLLVLAAGKGSRLNAGRPKGLVEVDGCAMAQRVVDAFRPFVQRTYVAIDSNDADLWREELRLYKDSLPYEPPFLHVDSPRGLISSLIRALRIITHRTPEVLWLAWCDVPGLQTASLQPIHDFLVRAGHVPGYRPSDVTIPVTVVDHPYIAIQGRGLEGGHARSRHRGDSMPMTGITDCGVFAFHRPKIDQLVERLERFQRDWEDREDWFHFLFNSFPAYSIVPVSAINAMSVNTPEQLEAARAHFARR